MTNIANVAFYTELYNRIPEIQVGSILDVKIPDAYVLLHLDVKQMIKPESTLIKPESITKGEIAVSYGVVVASKVADIPVDSKVVSFYLSTDGMIKVGGELYFSVRYDNILAWV